MAQLAAFWAKLTMLVSTIRFSDIVDILIVAYLIYNVIMLIRKTNSYRLAQGVLLILIALWLSGVLKLTMFNRILQKTVELGLIALVIIFQPELRRLLERMGSKALPRFGAKPLETLGMDNVISQTIAACTQLSATKTGALIVLGALLLPPSYSTVLMLLLILLDAVFSTVYSYQVYQKYGRN